MMTGDTKNKPLVSVDDLLADLEVVDTLQERVAFLEKELLKARNENKNREEKEAHDNGEDNNNNNNNNDVAENGDGGRFQAQHRLSVTSALTDPSFDADELAADMEEFSDLYGGENNSNSSGKNNKPQDIAEAERLQQRLPMKKRPSLLRSGSSSFRSKGSSNHQARRRVSFSCLDSVPSDTPILKDTTWSPPSSPDDFAQQPEVAATAENVPSKTTDEVPTFNLATSKRNRRATIGIDSLNKLTSDLSFEEDASEAGSRRSGPSERMGRRFTVASGSGADIKTKALSSTCRMTEDGEFTFALGKESRYHMDIKNVRELISLRNKGSENLSSSLTVMTGDSAVDKELKKEAVAADNDDGDESDEEDYARQIDEMYSKASNDDEAPQKRLNDKPPTVIKPLVVPNSLPSSRRVSMATGDMLRMSLANPQNKSVQRAIDAYLKSQLLNLVIVAKEQHTLQKQTLGDDNATAASGASAAAGALSFRQFDLFSVKSETLCLPPTSSSDSKLKHDGGRHLDPFKVQVADLVDQYPLPTSAEKSAENKEEEEYERMEPDALSSFCVPDGVSIRLIPRCAMDGARRIGWVGVEVDKHQLLAFTDGAGTTIHGVAITIREALVESETPNLNLVIDNLKNHRKRRVASTLLSRWWRNLRSTQMVNSGLRPTNQSSKLRRSTSAPEIHKKNEAESKKYRLGKADQSVRSLFTATSDGRSLDSDNSPLMDSTDGTPLTKKKKKKSLNSLMKRKSQDKIEAAKGETNASWGDLSTSSDMSPKKSKKLGEKIKKQLLGSSKKKNSESKTDGLRVANIAREVDVFMPQMTPRISPANSRSNILQKRKMLLRQNRESKTNVKETVSAEVIQRAEEAYEHMVNSDRLGDVVVVEKCYVLVGGRPKEQILLLSALQQMINWEREERALNQIQKAKRQNLVDSLPWHSSASLPTNGEDTQHSYLGSSEDKSNDDINFQRHELLTIIQHLLRLSPEQSRIGFPKRLRDYINGTQHRFEITLPVRKAPKISLPLPLPQVDTHWGFAKLLFQIGSDSLVDVLRLLLIERSVLLLGESSAEVTACSCALLELLQPYKWAGTFMPSLPLSMLDFVNSPVPFVAGVVAKYPCHIEKDYRTREAVGEGLSVLNLSTGKLCITTEGNVKKLLSQCKDPTFTLSFHEQRLKKLAEDKSSALCSFGTFIQQGFSPQESVTIHSACVSIERHLRGMSGVIGRCRDGWRHYGKFNAELNDFEFYPSLFVEPLRAQLEFQEMMSQTQLFVGYVDKRRLDDLTEDNIRKVKGVYIANWIYRRWFASKKELFFENQYETSRRGSTISGISF